MNVKFKGVGSEWFRGTGKPGWDPLRTKDAVVREGGGGTREGRTYGRARLGNNVHAGPITDRRGLYRGGGEGGAYSAQGIGLY